MVKIPVPKQFLTKGGKESGTTPYLIKPLDSIWEKACTLSLKPARSRGGGNPGMTPTIRTVSSEAGSFMFPQYDMGGHPASNGSDSETLVITLTVSGDHIHRTGRHVSFEITNGFS